MSEKSIGQIAYEAGLDGDEVISKFLWRNECDQEEWELAARGVLAHAASLLRKMGEAEPTYQRQDCFNRAATMLESLK